MDEGMGLIPDELVSGSTTSDTDAAEQIAQRLLPAVQELVGRAAGGPLSVRKMSATTDVSCYRIDIADCPYYATITEHNVIERYSIERRPRSAGRRVEMRPVLVEITHIFTVHDAEGALISATEALRASGKPATALEPNVFSELFEAARGVNAAEAADAARSLSGIAVTVRA